MGTYEVNIFSIGRGIRAHADILVMSKILSFYSGFVIDHVIRGAYWTKIATCVTSVNKVNVLN